MSTRTINKNIVSCECLKRNRKHMKKELKLTFIQNQSLLCERFHYVNI